MELEVDVLKQAAKAIQIEFSLLLVHNKALNELQKWLASEIECKYKKYPHQL